MITLTPSTLAVRDNCYIAYGQPALVGWQLVGFAAVGSAPAPWCAVLSAVLVTALHLPLCHHAVLCLHHSAVVWLSVG